MLPDVKNMTDWAVVACDQYTSEPEYWTAVEQQVGDRPSALHLILPEAHLKFPRVDERIMEINDSMASYLEQGLFKTLTDSMIYVERRQSDGRIRRGLVGMVDLEDYDFTPGSGALIRATEATVLERIPPRVRVRRGAPIELPHIMLLIDDPDRTVIEPLGARTDTMELLYDFDLMQGGGHIRGFRVCNEQISGIAAGLRRLCEESVQSEKYGLKDAAPLLFAVGDGNHSLAAAKACYEEQKKGLPPEARQDLPSRYALVEVVNNHDPALTFEPIHRVLFGVEPEAVLAALKAFYPDAYEGRGEGHCFSYVHAGGRGYVTVPNPERQLCVATVQTFLDAYLRDNGGEIDYIHGDSVVEELGSRPGNLGFLLPAMGKEQLFKTVMADGVLPRKAFSMGHAQDKRYYLEARKIVR
ncbi:MAG: DUF1015 domain-containing protein [Oscillospiraceae bacterium]|nr:DUF1015 domain-containing protein [Oscillospiraceae bacterium]